jgi:hypothetical protein
MNHKSKGLNLTAQASIKAEVKGTMADLKGAAMTTIQGGLVKIN